MKSICRPICLRSSSARRVEMQLLSSTMMAGYPSARQDGIRRGRDGLARVQAVPQDVVAWPSLFGRHQQLLDGTRATNDVRTDVTGVFCTSGSEREFTLEGSWYADEEIQAGADCD